MVIANIEKIKQEYTDKYVVVDARLPELARFADVVGQVKTVNMNGRALVEFQDYHLNIGWYDIDLDYLKVVDKPLPKEKKAEPKKPAAKKPAGDAAPAAAKPAAKPAGKPSTADILAKLKSGGAAKPAASGAAAPAEKPKPKPAAKPAEGGKLDRSKMSVADMLAAARGGAPKGEAASAAVESAPEAEPEPESPPPEPQAAEAAPPSGEIVKVDKSKMSIAEMVAYCREHDVG